MIRWLIECSFVVDHAVERGDPFGFQVLLLRRVLKAPRIASHPERNIAHEKVHALGHLKLQQSELKLHWMSEKVKSSVLASTLLSSNNIPTIYQLQLLKDILKSDTFELSTLQWMLHQLLVPNASATILSCQTFLVFIEQDQTTDDMLLTIWQWLLFQIPHLKSPHFAHEQYEIMVFLGQASGVFPIAIVLFLQVWLTLCQRSHPIVHMDIAFFPWNKHCDFIHINVHEMIQSLAYQDDLLLIALKHSLCIYQYTPLPFLHPDIAFSIFMEIISFDASILVDYLLSNETCSLEYLLFYTKYQLANWAISKATLLALGHLAQIMSTMMNLNIRLQKLYKSRHLLYNPELLCNRLTSVSNFYCEHEQRT